MLLKEQSKEQSRERAIARFRRYLLQRSWPRAEMALIVLATGGTGFLSSVALLHLGMHPMWLRYPLAVLAAYGAFLVMIRAWLALRHLQIESRESVADASDALFYLDVPWPSGDGGAGHGADAGNLFDLAADECLIVAILGAACLAVAAACAYVIVIAPSLLAEILLDSALSAGLYRRLRHIEAQSWTGTVFRKTGLLFLAVFLFFLAAGAAMHGYAPEADSVGDVFRHMRSHV